MSSQNYIEKLQTYLIVILFLFIPFFNILKFKLGNFLPYTFVCLILFSILFISLFFIKIKNRVNYYDSALIFPILMAFLMLVMWIFHAVFEGNNHTFYVLYYGSSIFIFFLLFFTQIDYFLDNYLLSVLKWSFIFFSSIILVDFILINLDLTHKQLLYGTKASHFVTGDNIGAIKNNNLVRPLGAFGQATVNGFTVVFTFLLLMAVDIEQKRISIIEKYFCFLLLFLVILIHGSGTIIVASILSIILIGILRLNFKQLFLGLLMIFILITILILLPLDLFVSTRLEPQYVIEIISIFINELLDLINRFDNVGEIIFGVGGVRASTNFQELMAAKFIFQMGIVMFSLYSIWFLILYLKSPNYFFKLIILFTVIGSQHYESMFRAYNMVFLLPILYYLILFDKKRLLRVSNE
jgi:hypothetical protein